VDGRVGDVDAKLGEARDGGGAYDGVLEDDAVVDVANVLGRLGGFGPLDAEQVEDADGELGELAIFDELAELRQGCGWIDSFMRNGISSKRRHPPASFESPMNLIMSKMASTTDFLKS
jgi:hypothetical protein